MQLLDEYVCYVVIDWMGKIHLENPVAGLLLGGKFLFAPGILRGFKIYK